MRGGPDTVHATAIALAGRAALIRGPSGAGKSDLALRCIGLGPSHLVTHQAELIADDRVIIEWQDQHLVVSAPASIAGRLEVRGLGLMDLTPATTARLVLVVDLVGPTVPIERLPEPSRIEILGFSLPQLLLHPFESSAPLKVLLALQRVYRTPI